MSTLTTTSFKAPTVKVLVGPDKEEFLIHESVIAKPGTFFETALKKEWIEGKERTVELLEDDPDVFELYTQWVYTGKIFCKSTSGIHSPTTSQNFDTIIDLYLLGQKLLDRVFQDRVIDALLATTHDMRGKETQTRWFPVGGTVDRLYLGTIKGCPMRRLLVDIYIQHGQEKWMTGYSQMDAEFLGDLGIAFFKTRADPQILRKLDVLDKDPKCAYHHHGTDEKCGSYVKKTESRDGGADEHTWKQGGQ